MSYKIGDSVRVKQLEDINKIFKIDQNDLGGMYFLKEGYEHYCGNIYKVKEITGCYYFLEDEDGQFVSGFFIEEMLEDVKENKMRYKIGDKVRVRQWDDMVEEFGTDEVGRINIKTGCRFTEEMKKFCGGVYEICSILERVYLLKDGAETIYWYFTDPMLEDVNLLSYMTDQLKIRVKNETLTFKNGTLTLKILTPKNDKHITVKKEGKEMEQKTQRERLEEQLDTYQRDSEIKAIEIIVPGKIVNVTMDDCLDTTLTMKCHEDDTFSLEKAIVLAYIKYSSGNLTPEGIEYEVERFHYYKSNMKKLKKAMKVYEIQQKLKALDEEEERIRANKKRKKIAQKKRRVERLAEEKLKETKEATKIYAEALKSALCGYEISENTVENMTKDMNTRV